MLPFSQPGGRCLRDPNQLFGSPFCSRQLKWRAWRMGYLDSALVIKFLVELGEMPRAKGAATNYTQARENQI